jgi:hypothetical protein
MGTVALAATALAGTILSKTALVWVLAVYWIDTAVVVLAALARQAVARRDTSNVRALGPFLLLARTRGDLSLHPGYPSVLLRNLRPVATGLLVAGVGTGLTVAAAWTTVPATALTPALGGALAVAAITAVIRHGIPLREYLQSGAYEQYSPAQVLPRKRLLAFLLYALPVWFAGDLYAQTIPATTDPGAARGAWTAVAGIIALLQLTVGLYVSRRPPKWLGEPDDAEEVDSAVLPETPVDRSPPSLPEQPPLAVRNPDATGVLLGGILYGLTGVGDAGARRWGGFSVAVLIAAVTGAVVIATVTSLPWVLLVPLAVVAVGLGGVPQFQFLFGQLEYRFYEDVVFAYDSRTETVRWRVPYAVLSNPSVERGLRGRPLWHSTGSVTASRTDTLPESALRFQTTDIAFVYIRDPETVAEWVCVGGPGRQE